MKPTREERLAGARAIRKIVMVNYPRIAITPFDNLSADERHMIEEQAEACIIAAAEVRDAKKS